MWVTNHKSGSKVKRPKGPHRALALRFFNTLVVNVVGSDGVVRSQRVYNLGTRGKDHVVEKRWRLQCV